MIKIPRRAFHCSKDKTPFKAGERYHSLLIIDEEKIDRFDYCVACFETVKKEEHTHWIGQIPPKGEKPTDEKAKQLFFALYKENREEEKKILLVLALYLSRKKTLSLRKEIRDENLFFELNETGELFSIQNFPLEKEETATFLNEITSRI